MMWKVFLPSVNACPSVSGLPGAVLSSHDLILPSFLQRELSAVGYHSLMPLTDPTKNDQCLPEGLPSSAACLLQWPVMGCVEKGTDSKANMANAFFCIASHHLSVRDLQAP